MTQHQYLRYIWRNAHETEALWYDVTEALWYDVTEALWYDVTPVFKVHILTCINYWHQLFAECEQINKQIVHSG